MKFEGGIYNDDGTKVDESLIPVPNLCVICKKHNTNNFMNNINETIWTTSNATIS
jgi:hypothetical protein